jgi:hypothetical protein
MDWAGLVSRGGPAGCVGLSGQPFIEIEHFGVGAVWIWDNQHIYACDLICFNLTSLYSFFSILNFLRKLFLDDKIEISLFFYRNFPC